MPWPGLMVLGLMVLGLARASGDVVGVGVRAGVGMLSKADCKRWGGRTAEAFEVGVNRPTRGPDRTGGRARGVTGGCSWVIQAAGSALASAARLGTGDHCWLEAEVGLSHPSTTHPQIQTSPCPCPCQGRRRRRSTVRLATLITIMQMMNDPCRGGSARDYESLPRWCQHHSETRSSA